MTFYCHVKRGGPQRMIYVRGEKFISEAPLIQSLLKPGFRCVDVGANIGYYTLMMRKAIGPGGHIVAIEPSPENLRELRMNVERNGLSNMVQILDCAVGDSRQRVGLREGINSGVTEIGTGAYEVQIDTLDDLITGPVDFIKMDIEGYETFALKGGGRLLREQRPVLFVEVHPAFLRNLGASATQVIEQLRAYGYEPEVHEQVEATSFLGKLAQLYLGIGLVRKVDNIPAYVANASADPKAEPFWAICRPAR